MKSLEYLFYGSIIALIILQGFMMYANINEPFGVITKILSGKDNDFVNLKCFDSNEKIIEVNLNKYGTIPYINGTVTTGGIQNISLQNNTDCINKNSCSFIVNTSLAGTDPAPGIPKVYQLSYKCEKPGSTKVIPTLQTPMQQNLTQQTPMQQYFMQQNLTQLPSFMDQNRLLQPFNDNELFEYKLFHIIVISCTIKETINSKIINKQIPFKQIYNENLKKMGIEPRIFERNLDAYMDSIKTQTNRTWKEFFESKLFLDTVTDNIEYYLNNPSQSKINDKQQLIGTIEYIRKPIINDALFLSFYNKCITRLNSLEMYSPISYNTQLYD